jgi:hypothetical protein
MSQEGPGRISEQNVEIVRRAFHGLASGGAIRDGKIVRVREYATRAEALQAAGAGGVGVHGAEQAGPSSLRGA